MLRKTIILSCILILISMSVPVGCFANDSDNDGMTCSELNMIPNDEAEGRKNLSILIAALNEGIKILVDDKYYLVGLGTPSKIDHDIMIEGITDNAEFTFSQTSMIQSSFLNVLSKNLLMSKIRFTSMQNEKVSAFRFFDTHKMKTLVIENCYFEGPIRLVNWEFTNGYIDPGQYDYGMESFAFIDNECKNIRESLIVVHNVPIKHSKINGNEIINFSNIFYNQEITNNNPYVDEVAQQMYYLEVKNNIVCNDDSWDGMYKEQMYHCFIFFEGNKCDYKNNHVEGLHVFDQETLVYDAYLSCIYLEYEDNYWKNNITFNSDPNYTQGRQLMKSKGAAYLDGYRGIERIYRNNTFIVEKAYADKMKRPYEELWVTMVEFDKDIERCVIEKNKIDVYILRLNSASVLTHNFTFNNNNIHAVKSYGDYTNCILPIAIHDSSGDEGVYIACDNNIAIDMPGTVKTKNNSLIRLSITNESIKNIEVTFKNNYVSWPDLDAIVSNSYNIDTVYLEIEMSDNTIITEEEPSLLSGILIDTSNIKTVLVNIDNNDFNIVDITLDRK